MGKGMHGVGSARRIGGVIIALVAVAMAVVFGAPARTRAGGAATVAVSQLNLRAEPGIWAPVVGTLWQGEDVALLAGPTPDDWYQVQTADQTGWAFGDLLALDGAGGDPGAGGMAGAAGAEHWVDVNRTTQTVTLYEGDTPLVSFWAAMGSDASDDGFFATAIGTYSVYEKYRGLSWTDWGGAWIDDWVGFDPNRLNGFHSYSMDNTGQVLPDGAGPTGGCVALDPAAADQLFAFVSVGTRVEVHR